MMFYKKRRAPNPILCVLILFLITSVSLYLFTGRIIHITILWNLLLAVLPLCLAIVLKFAVASRAWVKTVALGFLWLIFFPNAPYLITDFIHLQQIGFYTQKERIVYSSNLWDWLSLFQINIVILVGTCAGLFSLWIIHHCFLKRMAAPLCRLLLCFIFLVTGFAVYVGRFLRLNSWDVFSPSRFIAHLSGQITSFCIEFTLITAGSLFVEYALFSCFIAAAQGKIKRG